jgi:hypothetical protein
MQEYFDHSTTAECCKPATAVNPDVIENEAVAIGAWLAMERRMPEIRLAF